MNQADIALLVKATLQIYVKCLKGATLGIVKNWQIVPGSFALYLFLILVSPLAQPLGLAGGFIIGLIAICLLTLYYSWMSQIVMKDTLSFDSMRQFDSGLFSSIMSVAFILWLVEMAIGVFPKDSFSETVTLVLSFAIMIVFNPLPEVAYQRRGDGVYNLGSAAKFSQENWAEWFLPFLLSLSPIFVMAQSFTYLIYILAMANPLLPVNIFVSGFSLLIPLPHYLSMFIGLIIANWFMIFRGLLFRELDSSSRRSRVYRAKNM